MRLRCTNCDATFEGDKTDRCPKCLRRTSVIESIDVPLAVAGEGPAPWPAGTTCSLCLERPISSATFHLELAKPGSADSGGHHEWTTVRCRCCDTCRERVTSLPRLRLAVLPFAVVGVLLWLLSLASTLPMRIIGGTRVEGAMLSTLATVFVVGIPLVVLDRANHKLRGKLETSWLLRRVQERLGHLGGALSHELWRVAGDAPASVDVKDATDLLRG